MLYNGGALLWKLNLEASLSHILILKPAQFEDPFQNNGEMKAKFIIAPKELYQSGQNRWGLRLKSCEVHSLHNRTEKRVLRIRLKLLDHLFHLRTQLLLLKHKIQLRYQFRKILSQLLFGPWKMLLVQRILRRIHLRGFHFIVKGWF